MTLPDLMKCQGWSSAFLFWENGPPKNWKTDIFRRDWWIGAVHPDFAYEITV